MTKVNFTPKEIHSDPILNGLTRDGLALTRENYIIRNWGNVPDDWTAEHEAELPKKLQDWTAFEKDQGSDEV